MAKIRNVSKNLASMEDLLQGKGVATQTRSKKSIDVHRIDVPFAVDSVAEMQALNLAQYTRARVYSDASTFTDYIYDPDATSGIAPNEGSGYWVPKQELVTATGTSTPRTLSNWAKNIDNIQGIDYGYGSNIDLVRSWFTDIQSHVSSLDRSKIQQEPLATKTNSRLFIKPSDIDSCFESGVRLINPDYYDISFTVTKESSQTFPSVISQSISTNAPNREMQIFQDTGNNQFKVLLRGNQQALDYTGAHAGNFRVKYSDSENELTLYRDGVLVSRINTAFAGGASEPTATTVIAGRHSGDLATYGAAFADGVLSDFKIYEKRQIVVVGASIMNGAFSNTNEGVKYLHTIGSTLMDLKEFAVSGDTSSDILARIPSILSSVSDKSLFIIHAGGNDVTQTRPFSTASGSEVTTLRDNLVSMINLIKEDGHDVCLANLTFRNYPGLGDESNGSLTYNKAIHEPLIRSLTPEWWDYKENAPVVNLYKWANDNQGFMQADGVHFTSAGYTALREYILSTVSGLYKAPSIDINLDNYSAGVTYYYDFGGIKSQLSLQNILQRDIFIGVDGINYQIYDVEGVGTQLLLKNISGSLILSGAVVNGSDLAQVYFDASDVFQVSADALDPSSKWRLVNGGNAAANTTKNYVRVE